ncbi:MAG TPA: DUF998 domain-containing protein [Pseudonocardiaceae bacterium]|nr:DUF998 domain-containing protein [Pseudonocardiaceae bacterium]
MNKGIRRWARLTIIADIVFTLAWIAAATWQGPNYSTTAHTISDMYADGAPGAWVLIVVFSICGAIGIVFALRSLWPALRPAGLPAGIGSALLAMSIFGLGDLLSPFEREGCRLADPGCTPGHQLATSGGAMDSILSNLGVLALAISGFFLSAALRKLPAWAGWARATLIGTVVFVLVGLADVYFSGANLGGFGERLVALIGAAGITALAIGVVRRTNTPMQTVPVEDRVA